MRQNQGRQPNSRPPVGPHSHGEKSRTVRSTRQTAQGMRSMRQDDRRRKRVNMSRRRTILPTVLLLLALAAAMVVFLLKAPFFKIHSVRVDGNRVVRDEDLVHALGDTNQNILTFPAEKWRERARALEGVADVTFERELPDRLVIHVKESYVLGVFVYAGRQYYVDAQGKITDHYNPDLNRIKPIPLEKELASMRLGEDFFEDSRELDFLSTLHETRMAEKVSKVRFEKPQAIVIMYNDIEIRFGAPNDIIHKFTDLAAVLQEVENKGVNAQEILLEEGKHPIVVTKNGQQVLPESSESQEETEGN